MEAVMNSRAQTQSYPVAEAIGEAIARAWRGIGTALTAFAEARGRAAAIRELERLSDRTLRDIGLHRSQIRSTVYAGRP
jgi:uncharacterized protein YjiS (DUF1127 family)